MDEDFDRLSDVEKVMRINKHALDEKGQLKSFMEQYGEYAFVKETLIEQGVDISRQPEELWGATPFVLALNGGIYGIPEMSNRPLVVTNQALKHIRQKHLKDAPGDGVFLEKIFDGLAEKMSGNVLVFQNDVVESHRVFVLQEESRNGHPITTIVEVDNNAKGVEVSAVVSNHGRKDLVGKIARAVEKGRRTYVNERTGAWLLALNEGLVAESSHATGQDLARSGETDLLAGRLAAIRRLSDEYCSKYPDSPEAAKLLSLTLGPAEQVSESPIKIKCMSNALMENLDPAVPWYVSLTCEKKMFNTGTSCSQFVTTANGQYGITSEIHVEPADAVAGSIYCSFNACEKAVPETVEWLRGNLTELGIDSEWIRAAPEERYLSIEVFTPWDMEPATFFQANQILEKGYDEIGERSWRFVPENLIEWEKTPPEGFRALTYTDGSVIPTTGAQSELPAAAKIANLRVPYLGQGPTAVLYEAGPENYGVVARIDALFDKSGNGYIDRQDGFEGTAKNTETVLRSQAVRFAWNHPDTTVMVATDAIPDRADDLCPSLVLKKTVLFQVFIPDNLPWGRFEEVYEDLDREFAHTVIDQIEAWDSVSGRTHEVLDALMSREEQIRSQGDGYTH